VRNYVRIVAPDDAQGAAAAVWLANAARAEPSSSCGSPPGPTRKRWLPRSSAKRGRARSRPRRSPTTLPAFATLTRRVAARRHVVYIAGLTEANGRRLARDLRAALGPSALLIAPDGFRSVGQSVPAGEGLRYTGLSVPAELLSPAGKRFLSEFGQRPFADRGALGAPEAAQAAEGLLDAIAGSDGTRPSVVDELFKDEGVETGSWARFRTTAAATSCPGRSGVYRFERGREVIDDVVRVPLAGRPREP
jgi:hypothetical protein